MTSLPKPKIYKECFSFYVDPDPSLVSEETDKVIFKQLNKIYIRSDYIHDFIAYYGFGRNPKEPYSIYFI